MLETAVQIQCTHHWVFPPPRGKISTGVCKYCGDRMEAANSLAYVSWLKKDEVVPKEDENSRRCIKCEKRKPMTQDHFRWSKIHDAYMDKCIRCEQSDIKFLKRV